MYQIRTFIIFHAAFSILCIIAAMIPSLNFEIKLFLLAAIYHLCLMSIALVKKIKVWLKIYSFVLPLSFLLILPIWVVSVSLHSVIFLPSHIPSLGMRPIYMPLIWSFGLFMVIFVGNNILMLLKNQPYKTLLANLFLGISGLFITFGYEQIIWRLREIQHAKLLGHSPIYIILAKTILSIGVFNTYQYLQNKDLATKIIGAIILMIIYLGVLMFSYFLVEMS